jgi:DNA-binding CsgD family transcriptional regulator
MSKLSPPQKRILQAAKKNPNTDIRQYMEAIKSPAIRDKVIESMIANGLVVETDAGYIATEQGFAALKQDKTPKPERITKNSILLDMLRQGTTIAEIMQATGWQKHTVFGTISNLKKKQNLNISSEKSDGQDRVYKIA